MARKTKKSALIEALGLDAAQPTNLTPQMTKTLADHDKRFHPKGWKPGDTCKFRDNINLGNEASEYDDEVDYLKAAAEHIRTAAKHVNRSISNPSYTYNQADLDIVDDLNDVVSDIGKRDTQAKELAERIAEIQAFRKGGASALANGKVGYTRHYHASQWQRPQTATPAAPATPAQSQATSQQQPTSQPSSNLQGSKGGASTVPLTAQQQTDLRTKEANARATIQVLTSQMKSAPQQLKSVFKAAMAAAKKDLSDAQAEMRKNGMSVNSTAVLDLGKGALMEDGDTGKVLNQRRKADGLPELQSLGAIDGIVASCQANFQKQSKKLAAYFGEPELDISKKADFDTVQENWADTVKRLFNESAVVTATKAHRLLDILNSGGFQTKYKGDSLKQERFDTLLGMKHGTATEVKASEAEAPLSATLCSTDSNRMFQNKAFGTFGILGIEWKKDSNNYAMAFSNCDIGTPGDMEADGATGYGRTFNPSLASNPSITSLAAFDNGIASNDFRLRDRIAATGYMTPSGHYMSSYCNAIKLLRKGAIPGDALDFDNAVNNASKSPFAKPGKAPRAFGWNEVLLLGKAGIGDIGALHFNTQAWTNQYNKEEAEIANGTWRAGESRPTQGEPNARNYIANLIKTHGAMLKQHGIKVIVDGQEEIF